MAKRGEFDIDNQEDMAQRSDEQIPGNSQISDKETGVDNSNKEMLNMMHAMFSKLEENQEKMNINLEEKLKENQEKMNSNLEERMFSKLEKINKMVEDHYTKIGVMVEDHYRKIEEIVEDQCTKMKEMGIKMLPPKIGRAHV